MLNETLSSETTYMVATNLFWQDLPKFVMVTRQPNYNFCQTSDNVIVDNSDDWDSRLNRAQESENNPNQVFHCVGHRALHPIISSGNRIRQIQTLGIDLSYSCFDAIITT